MFLVRISCYLWRVCVAADAWRGKKRPAGGSGGRGGDVLIRSVGHREDLGMSEFVYNGGVGGNASGQGKSGKKGKDVVVEVPCGTLVKEVRRMFLFEEEEEEEVEELGLEEEGWEEEDGGWGILVGGMGVGDGVVGEVEVERRKGREDGVVVVDRKRVVAELVGEGQEVLVAKGGIGGLGNVVLESIARKEVERGQRERGEGWVSDFMSKKQRHMEGERGEVRFLELEMRLLADVALVGFPNAGKSSLLSVLSKAQPKIASYPFTTLHPTLGTLHYADGTRLRAADMPGIVRGASADRGLGLEFLRHIKRTKVIALVVDAIGPNSVTHPKSHVAHPKNHKKHTTAEKTPNAGQQTAKRGPHANLHHSDLSAEVLDMLRREEKGGGVEGAGVGGVEGGESESGDFGVVGVGGEDDSGEIAGVDGSSVQPTPASTHPLSRDPVSDLQSLLEELEAYEPGLSARVGMVVANKCDLPGAEVGVEVLRRATRIPVVPVSAKERKGLETVAAGVKWMVNEETRGAGRGK